MRRRAVLIEGSAFEDLEHWARTDPKMLKKVIDLIADIRKSPFSGIGKPEALKHRLKGYWSRRINEEHRLVYSVNDEEILIAACRYHYE